jgi:surface antigen
MRLLAVRKSLRQSGLAVLFAAVLGVALPAFADPPSHAPAHGWRKKHDPYYRGYTGRQWEHDYGIVDGRCNRDAIGTVLGGVVGGAIGSQVGEGRAVAIVLGTVIGAVIGRQIGRNLDDQDRGCIGHALELAKDGQSVRWLNERFGVTYVVKPVGGVQKGGTCRNFELQASRDGKAQSQQGRACRTGDGTWQMS